MHIHPKKPITWNDEGRNPDEIIETYECDGQIVDGKCIEQAARYRSLYETRRQSLTEASLDDLDRCPHGRHKKDACFGCEGGISQGNPFLMPGQQIGFNISGRPIYVRGERFVD